MAYPIHMCSCNARKYWPQKGDENAQLGLGKDAQRTNGGHLNEARYYPSKEMTSISISWLFITGDESCYFARWKLLV